MTFSGLPSLRDPKQSYKNSVSSASSAASSTSSSSSTADSPVKATPTEQQPHNEASEGGALPILVPISDTDRANMLTSSTVLPGEAMTASLIEASFQDLVQANYHNTLDSKLGAVPSALDLKQPAAAPKKKASAPHNLSPAHSAAYRKRLNVNQVCDWCRYRKIRCDRESPCNSCQHSKRECIRTPPSALLSNQNKDKESDADQQDSTSKTKRSRMDDDKDAPSRRASKSYRGSSISSHPSSSYTSYSSGDDDGLDGDDDRLSVASSKTHASQSLSSTPTSLTLAELGLAGLDGLGSGSPLHLLGSLDAAGSGSNSQQFAGSSSFSSPTLSSHGNLQDQEHLERMKRIELLLCNVIPGASEFIAHGTQNALVPQQQQPQQQSSEQKGLSLNLHGLKHQSRQKRDVILSPQELLSRISLASPGAGPAAPLGARNLSGLAASQEQDNQSSDASNHEQHNLPTSQQAGSPSSTPDYVQRMERIEILLRTVQKLPHAQGMFSETLQKHPDASEDLSASRKKKPQKNSKKHGKTEARKQKSGNMINSNGAVVKRPHVAAGFAGQKPPPKLPQAIAEAARKRQATRKKRVTAAAARAAASTNTTATSAMNSAAAQSSTSLSLEAQDTTRQTSAAPLAVPSTPINVSSFNHGQELQQQARRLQHQQQQKQQQQQQQRQMEMLSHPHRQVGVPAFNMYQQHQQSQHRLPAAMINSMAIPMASSYGSLVVPASSSTCSSATSSPRIERAEALSMGGTEQDDMGMSPRSVDSSVRAGSVDQTHFSEAQFPFRQQTSGCSMHSMPYSQVQAPRAVGMGMDFNLMEQTEIQPFSGQYVSQLQQPLPTSQENSYPDFGLNMGESLESLMKKNMGSFGGLLSDLSGGAPLGSPDSTTITSPSLSMPMQSLLQGPSAPAFEHGVYDPSTTSVQFNYLQQQRDLQQRQVRPAQPAHHDTLKSMWIPSHSGSFAVPANTEFSWQQQQQQHHSTPSINISANDSPLSEVGPELELDGDQMVGTQQQQQPLSAHALFQQQHEQQQLQQEQLRRNSLVLDALQPQQHRASIQHQHLQSFYIPQMQDEDDDGVFQAMYDSTKSTAGEDMWNEDPPVMAKASSSIHSGNPEA
ncbi:hypothetical protein BGZ75_001269 [Mortierella antarctica]|nr:hypothetical protein BGZ75_001269 [Mortierella antarctica]